MVRRCILDSILQKEWFFYHLPGGGWIEEFGHGVIWEKIWNVV